MEISCLNEVHHLVITADQLGTLSYMQGAEAAGTM
jgi:hypothetical protein